MVLLSAMYLVVADVSVWCWDLLSVEPPDTPVFRARFIWRPASSSPLSEYSSEESLDCVGGGVAGRLRRFDLLVLFLNSATGGDASVSMVICDYLMGTTMEILD